MKPAAARAVSLTRALVLVLTLAGGTAAAAPEWRWDVGGRLQLDHARFDGVHAADGAAHHAGYLRRAGMQFEADWARRVRAVLELEMDSTRELGVDAAWLGLRSDETDRRAVRHEVRLGRIDPDVGLEQATSSSWTWGIERSAIWDLAPDVADSLAGHGLRGDAQGRGWQASAGLYDKRSHRALAGRGVWLPRREAGAVLHLGLSLARTAGWRDDGRVRSRLGVRAVSEHDAGRRSTLAASAGDGAFGGESVAVAEFAWLQGGWAVQSEWLVRRLAGREAQPDRRPSGAYLLVARSFGAGRRYDVRRARIGSPQAYGAGREGVEVFYRLDRLVASAPATAGTAGDPAATRGRATVHVLGLSWHPARHWRVMLNASRARSTDANDVGQRSGRGIALRLQATI